MGSLFSSTKEEKPSTRTSSIYAEIRNQDNYNYNYNHIPASYNSSHYPNTNYYLQRSHTSSLSNSSQSQLANTTFKLQSSQRTGPDYSVKKAHASSNKYHPVNAGLKLYTYILDKYGWEELRQRTCFHLVTLDNNSQEYQTVYSLFKRTTQKHYKIHCIQEVQNPYLYVCYLLKKAEMGRKPGRVQEKYLFHGTQQKNLEKICENNFNWRMHGENKGNIFGRGVSFTPISCYASHYSDKGNAKKVMFLARVLVKNEIVGNRNMTIPPFLNAFTRERYDTAVKHNKQVFVKFSDNEFYPNYIIHYTGTQQKQMKHIQCDDDYDYYL